MRGWAVWFPLTGRVLAIFSPALEDYARTVAAQHRGARVLGLPIVTRGSGE